MNATKKIDLDAISSAMAIHINKGILSDIAAKPHSRVLNLETLTNEVIKNYIREKHTQEWARRPTGSEEALEQTADWFKGELDKLYTFICLNPD